METVFQDVVRDCASEGRTVLLSSHILSEVEALCDRVTIIRAGRAAESGTFDELRHLTRTTVVVETARTPELLGGLAGVHDLEPGPSPGQLQRGPRQAQPRAAAAGHGGGPVGSPPPPPGPATVLVYRTPRPQLTTTTRSCAELDDDVIISTDGKATVTDFGIAHAGSPRSPTGSVVTATPLAEQAQGLDLTP